MLSCNGKVCLDSVGVVDVFVCLFVRACVFVCVFRLCWVALLVCLLGFVGLRVFGCLFGVVVWWIMLLCLVVCWFDVIVRVFV